MDDLTAIRLATMPTCVVTRELEAMWREHCDMLQQEINCWRMYGYIVEVFMDELQLYQPESYCAQEA